MFEADSTGLELPEPDPDSIASSSRLVARIVERIAQHDDAAIRFDEYMQMALYEPGLGYYSSAVEFGKGGDFVTAPQISPLFADCLANQIEALIDQGCEPRILEFGAGNGHLCAQLLRAAPALESYHVLDLSAELKQRQQNHLQQQLNSELIHKVGWLERLPEGFDGIVLANEVFDAMPVRLVEKQDGWIERGISFDGERFDWCAMVPDEALLTRLKALETRHGDLPRGYRSEVNMNFEPWMQAMAESCNRAVMLAIDYGYEQANYYHPQRDQGTLICHYRHRVHDNPLIFPGLQDITAFVDFDALADAAEASGFEPIGLVTQAEFLLANGLLEAAERHYEGADSNTRIAIAQQVKTLSLPQEMGEKFKVLALQLNMPMEIPAMRRGVSVG